MKTTHLKSTLFLYFLIALMSIGCKDNENTEVAPATNPVTKVWLHDIGNNELSSDFKVVFDIIQEHNSTEFRIVISKQSPATPISSSLLESLQSDAYTTVNVGASHSYNVDLGSGQLDSDGDPLAHGQSYMAYVYSPDLTSFTTASDAVVLSENQLYQGRYKGYWGDNLFAPVAISGILESTGANRYKGPVFISAFFEPAYGALDDNGSYDMTIIDGEITSFKYTQHAPDYRGGCPGLYEGTGTVDDDFNLTINYIGDDCDGQHFDGLMTLTRLWKD